MEHEYVSTACLHGIHSRCALTCKFCGSPCQCGCEHSSGDDEALQRYLEEALTERYRLAVRIAESVVALLREIPPTGN